MNKIKLLLTVFVVALLGLGGCSSSDDVLTLGIWTSSPEEVQFIEERVAFYEEETGTSVEIEIIPDEYTDNLQLQLAAGEGPDVFYLDSIYTDQFIEAEAIMPLNDYMTLTDEDLEDFQEPLLDAFTRDEEIYALPKDANSLVLYYDADAFEEYGVKVPTTWEELEEAARIFSESGDYEAGIVLRTDFARFSPFLFQSGGTVIDEEGNLTFNTPETAAAFDFYYNDLLGTDLAKTDEELGGNETAFTTGKVPMMISGGWAVQTVEQGAPDMNWEMVELPSGKEDTSMLFTVGYAVNAETDNVEEAVEFVEFMTSEEVQNMVVDSKIAVPTRKSSGEYYKEQNPELSANQNQFENSSVYTFGPDGTQIADELTAAGERIYIGGETPEDSLDEAEANLNK